MITRLDSQPLKLHFLPNSFPPLYILGFYCVFVFTSEIRAFASRQVGHPCHELGKIYDGSVERKEIQMRVRYFVFVPVTFIKEMHTADGMWDKCQKEGGKKPKNKQTKNDNQKNKTNKNKKPTTTKKII